MALFDKIKKLFDTGGGDTIQTEVCKSEPNMKLTSSDSPVSMTKEQKDPVEDMANNLTWFLTLLRLDMLVLYGVYNLNLDPDNDNAFVDLNGFGTGMPAYTLYGAYRDIDRRMGGNWSMIKYRCAEKAEKLSQMAKMPFIEIKKWEEIRKTVLMDMLKDVGNSDAPISYDRTDKRLFYQLCTNICNSRLRQLESQIR